MPETPKPPEDPLEGWTGPREQKNSSLTYLSPGARKEKIRRRRYGPLKRSQSHRYVELHAASAFSFLEGSSLPEDLVQRAVELGLPGVALVDRNGISGAPRFFKAARESGLKALVGAEVTVAPEVAGPTKVAFPLQRPRLTLLVENSQGYRHLCRLLTAAARGRPKGEAMATWEMIEHHAGGLHLLVGGEKSSLTHHLVSGGPEVARNHLDRLSALFPHRTHVEIQRHGRREEEWRRGVLHVLAHGLRLPTLATNGVRYARPEDKDLHDALSCLAHHTELDHAGRLLAPERERHLKGAAEMAALFAHEPELLHRSLELADRLDFTLEDLGYRFPNFPLPPGETLASHLRRLTWSAARTRFRPLTARAQAQLEKELNLIEQLDLSGYFLIVWDIVQFCKREGIMAQGRGSAANSAVCYALAITAVDPVKMELLFERFLSEERGEWPDIDLDLPSGEPRERVIQYVYQRYGPHGAAMTANVITYRARSAAREMAKVLGFSREQQDRLSKQLRHRHYGARFDEITPLAEALHEAGLDPEHRRVKHFANLWQRIQNLPRHLGQHSGGMIIARGRLDEVVPLEPASMPDRVVVQWDKDDCADLGLIKIDLLGLGMLQALEEAVPLIRQKEGVEVNYAHLPPDDPKVYRMLQKADTIGLFQVESRAQIASLPRNRPTRFYDLVIQVAIIRPGPITGGLVHPYFERRLGREKVDCLHPSLEPILKRTLGVPLFQEQLLRMAMTAAGFSGGEAEELRRAMGFKRSMERMHGIEKRLRRGMEERGIRGETQDQIVKSITSFALYGFPESHAASFALIAYASAWLKAHHPTAFYVCLLNAWPMGFYHPSSLLQDALRHGVQSRPVDVHHSGWACRWEDRNDRNVPRGSLRLGLRYVKGLRRDTGERIESEAAKAPFEHLLDFERRCQPNQRELTVLAHAGALASFGQSRRSALWQAAQITRKSGPLLAELPPDESCYLPEMTPFEEMTADFTTTSVTTGRHPMSWVRPQLNPHGVLTAVRAHNRPSGQRVRIAGSVVVRQRPGTAKGLLFVTLEDETGMIQAVLMPDIAKEHRRTLSLNPALVVEGILQKKDGSCSVRAEKVWGLPKVEVIPSHDYH